jgi:hypothetical protein
MFINLSRYVVSFLPFNLHCMSADAQSQQNVDTEEADVAPKIS